MALTEISWFIAGMLATCGVWVFFRLAQTLFIKDAIAEIKVKK
jgi:hypothetical protein